MFRCETCGEEYETRESFALSETGTDGEEFMVFDGEHMRDTCPMCGGLIYSMDETCLPKGMQRRKLMQKVA